MNRPRLLTLCVVCYLIAAGLAVGGAKWATGAALAFGFGACWLGLGEVADELGRRRR